VDGPKFTLKLGIKYPFVYRRYRQPPLFSFYFYDLYLWIAFVFCVIGASVHTALK